MRKIRAVEQDKSEEISGGAPCRKPEYTDQQNATKDAD